MEKGKNPSVLVVSCCESRTSKDLVEHIIGGESFGHPERTEDEIDFYEWKVSTKYYNADVDLCVPAHRTVPSTEFAGTVEAVVIHFSPEKRETFATVQTWLRTIEELYTPSVKLLTCDHCQASDNVGKDELHAFCIQNDLELIQLHPTEVDSDEEEFGSIHGVSRVRGALHAHSWSNLVLKSRPVRRPVSSNDHADTLEDDTATTVPPAGGDAIAEVDDSFGQLFSRLHEFRAAANTLSSDERKNFAEKVAKDFLMSLDVDADDLSD